MPNYDYVCEDCGHKQEEFHRMSETPEVKCSKCGSVKTVKAVTATHQINMNNHPGSSMGDF